MPTSLTFSEVSKNGSCNIYSDWNTPDAKLFLGLYPIVANYIFPLITLMLIYSRIACVLHNYVKVGENQTSNASGVTETQNYGESSTVFITNTALASVAHTSIPSNDDTVFTLSELKTETKFTQNRVTSNSINRNINAVHNSHGKQMKSKPSHNVLKTSLWIAMCYVCCYTMNQLYYFFSAFGLVNVSSEIFYHIRFVLVFLHCSLNPVIYCVKLKLFRDGVKWFFSRAMRK